MAIPRDFREFVVEPEQELAAAIHQVGGLLHIHCLGPLTNVLEDFMTLGADCLHPLEAPPLGESAYRADARSVVVLFARRVSTP